MKRIGLLLVILTILVIGINNVYAKDTIISINKYKDEKLMFIKESYNIENKQDGLITGGYFLKEEIEKDDTTYNDYQVILVKYKTSGKKAWTYVYGKTKEDYIDSLEYTYDDQGIINGYLITAVKTNDIEETNNEETIFIKIDLEGKQVFEKDLNQNKKIRITKIKPTYDENNIVNGYIAIGNNENNSYIIKLDRECNVLWIKESNQGVNYTDLSIIKDNNKIIGYSIIRINNNIKELVKYNLNGEEEKIIDNKLEEYINTYLEESDNGFILYGATKEVKLKKGSASYFLVKYNSNVDEEWETIGNNPLDKNKTVKLLPVKKDNIITKYLLLYSNDIAKSTEVVRIKIDGEIKEKIKKIYDEYYSIEDFTMNKDILYLVGQINCPEDDTCDYDDNSLFLISDEDKVIEVEDNDSKNIIIITLGIIIVIVGLIVIRKRKNMI